jgi:hypothetical protein
LGRSRGFPCLVRWVTCLCVCNRHGWLFCYLGMLVSRGHVSGRFESPRGRPHGSSLPGLLCYLHCSAAILQPRSQSDMSGPTPPSQCLATSETGQRLARHVHRRRDVIFPLETGNRHSWKRAATSPASDSCRWAAVRRAPHLRA